MDRERVLPNQTVLVEGGRITALGPASKVSVPAGAVRVDGRGKYLIPGLTDMHYGPVHNVQPPHEGEEQVFADEMFIRYLTHGVTALRSLKESSNGEAQQLQRIFAEFPIPRMYLATEPPKIPWSNPDSVAISIARIKAAGYNQVAGDSVIFLDSIAMAALRRAGLPIVTHLHSMSFTQALRLGISGGSVEHLYMFWDSLVGRPGPYATGGKEDTPLQLPVEKIPALAAAVNRAGLWVNPTLSCLMKVYPNINKDLGLLQLVKALQDAGVKMLLGSDSEGGDGPASVHGELVSLVQAGLTPYQALLTGTRHVAEYFQLLDSAGTVAIGRRADLVLLNGNPLKDIRQTRELAGVMLAGWWFDRVALDQRQVASRNTWFKELLRSQMPGSFLLGIEGILPYLSSPPRSMEQWQELEQHGQGILALVDSLNQTTDQEYKRVLLLVAADLGKVRTMMTREEREAFDRNVQPWLREQARQGYQVVIPGVQPVS